MAQVHSPYHTIIYERLVQQPSVRSELCEWWGIPFNEDHATFSPSFDVHGQRQQVIYCVQNPPGLFDTVKYHSKVHSSITSHRLLDDGEITMVEKTVGKEYLQLWGSTFDDVRAALKSKSWVAFDLDDTLHGFRAASGAALETVLTDINAEHWSDLDAMRSAYRGILAEKTSSAFVDGRTSRDYRVERFQALLQKVHVTHDEEYLDRLADLYQEALSKSLCLKPGAMDLLQLLKNMGRKIVVITEGPEDAQVWTIQQLGIYNMIDFIGTTNHFGVSKVDGLLKKVMQTLEILAAELVSIGDNRQRDIDPAVQADVYAIHYAEDDNIYLDQVPIRVNTHYEICAMFDDKA